MRPIIAGIALLLLAWAPVPVGETCTCAYTTAHGGWCGGCEVGHLVGITICSRDIYDIVHTHGHPADPTFMRCESCRQALTADGFCERSGVGFVAGEMYVTRLAYWVAKGKPAGAATIVCPACRSHIGRLGRRDAPEQERPAGWCEACRAGIFGNLLYEDRASFEAASAELELLVTALRVEERCHTCATAMLTGGMCPDCRIDFAAGWPGKPPAPESRGGG